MTMKIGHGMVELRGIRAGLETMGSSMPTGNGFENEIPGLIGTAHENVVEIIGEYLKDTIREFLIVTITVKGLGTNLCHRHYRPLREMSVEHCRVAR